MGFRPSHRSPDEIQPEVCALCGNLVGHRHLLESQVEGLRGYNICDLHRFERRARVTPSFRDIRAFSRLPSAPTAGQRLEPMGEELWFVDPLQDLTPIRADQEEFIIADDGKVIVSD